MAAAADEQLTQVLDDDQLGCADELLNITKGQSRLQPATNDCYVQDNFGYLEF